MAKGQSTLESKVWLLQRPRIKQLYLTDDLTRQATRHIMKCRYDFDASDKQYKYQICTKWQFQKTLTSEDKRDLVLIAQRHRQQDDVSTTFFLSGRQVKDKSLFSDKRGVGQTDSLGEPKLPRNVISCFLKGSPENTSTLQRDSPTGAGSPELLCMTCLICENDIYGMKENLWQTFQAHLVGKHPKHTSLSKCQLFADERVPQTGTRIPTLSYRVVQETTQGGRTYFSLDTMRFRFASVSVIQDRIFLPRLWIAEDINGNIAKIVGELSGPAVETSTVVVEELLRHAEVMQAKATKNKDTPRTGPDLPQASGATNDRLLPQEIPYKRKRAALPRANWSLADPQKNREDRRHSFPEADSTLQDFESDSEVSIANASILSQVCEFAQTIRILSGKIEGLEQLISEKDDEITALKQRQREADEKLSEFERQNATRLQLASAADMDTLRLTASLEAEKEKHEQWLSAYAILQRASAPLNFRANEETVRRDYLSIQDNVLTWQLEKAAAGVNGLGSDRTVSGHQSIPPNGLWSLHAQQDPGPCAAPPSWTYT